METAGNTLPAAVALGPIGLVLLLGGKLRPDQVPGDILIERDGVTIFGPLASMLLLVVVPSLFVELVRRP